MVVINFLIGYTSYLALHKIYQWWYGEPRIQNTPVVAPIENKLLDRMAVNWAFGHNRTSITRKREIGAGFYYFDQNVHVPGGHVAVKNVPNVAGGGNIAVYNGQLGERSSCDPIPNPKPVNGTLIATIHCHSNLSNGLDFDEFSNEDIGSDNDDRIPGYLVTPVGSLKRHDPTNFNEFWNNREFILARRTILLHNLKINAFCELLRPKSLPYDMRYIGVSGFVRRISDALDIIDHIFS